MTRQMTVIGSRPPEIFDRALLAGHRLRAARQPEIPDFLLERVAEDFADRLMVVKREFGHVLSLSDGLGVVRRQLEPSAQDWDYRFK